MEVIDPAESKSATLEVNNAQPNTEKPNPGPKPSNYLVGAILSTIFCCLPFGIAAIIYAGQVDSLWYAEKYDAAREMSRKASKWMWAGVITAIACWVIYFTVIVSIGIGAAMMSAE